MRGRSNATHRGFGIPGYAPTPEGWEPGDTREQVADEQVGRERAALREVVRRLLAGGTLAAQLAYLNAEGFRTYTGGGWTAEALRTSLRRPALAGIATHHGEEVGVLPGEPILDRETYDRLQSFLDSRRRGRVATPTYMLTGALVCGQCGRRMVGRPRTGCAPYPLTGDPVQDADRTARQYWCIKRGGYRAEDTGCGRITVDQRFADEVVTEATLARLSDPRHADAIAAHGEQVAKVRAEVGAEVARLEADADALAEKVAAWGVGRVDKAMRPITARLEALRARLEALEAPSGPVIDPDTVAAEWASDTVAEQHQKVRAAFPDGITVRPTDKRGRLARTPERFGF